ncbi:MAG: hypothetical protein CMG00_04485 [Candidatus Marinimicrobia bacterium]|nr:hypothetical protein [Candidatus Neomarinimicrobiota bacterium]|tara:strand:- start:672 stop:1346 length:675 start_codon:yes stop_codon:yes gene_type:complete
MIDVNLLSKDGVVYSDDKNFFIVDESILLDDSKDFESIHVVESIKVKSRNRFFLILFALLTISLVAFSTYYQFSIKSKAFVDSENLKDMIYYMLDEKLFYLNEMNVSSSGISATLSINKNSFNDFKNDLGHYVDSVRGKRKFEVSKSSNILYLKYPYFTNYISVFENKDEKLNMDVVKDRPYSYDFLDSRDLKHILNQLFNDRSFIYNFTIKRINSDSYKLNLF